MLPHSLLNQIVLEASQLQHSQPKSWIRLEVRGPDEIRLHKDHFSLLTHLPANMLLESPQQEQRNRVATLKVVNLEGMAGCLEGLDCMAAYW